MENLNKYNFEKEQVNIFSSKTNFLPEKSIDIDKKLNEIFPTSFLDRQIGNTCIFLNNLEKRYPNINRLGLKKAVATAIIASQFIAPTPLFAKNLDQSNYTHLKQNTNISTNEFIPKDFPDQNENINKIEQKYDGPSVRINSIPSGVNWVMPDNMSSSSNPDYNIYSEDCGWILLDNNSHNINPSISFNNFSINFGTADSNQSYIYRVGIKVYDKFGNLIAQIYGESPICNKDNYNSFNVGFSTNHFSTGYSQYGSAGEQYVDENTKNTLYLHNAKQLAFEAALRNLPALKPLTPPPSNTSQINNTNQNLSQQYSSNYTENNLSQAQVQPTKINFCNPFDLNTPVNHDTILYTDYGPKVKINYLETGKTKIVTINQYPFNIMSAIDPNYGGIVEVKILQENGKPLNDAYNKTFNIEKPPTK